MQLLILVPTISISGTWGARGTPVQVQEQWCFNRSQSPTTGSCTAHCDGGVQRRTRVVLQRQDLNFSAYDIVQIRSLIIFQGFLRLEHQNQHIEKQWSFNCPKCFWVVTSQIQETRGTEGDRSTSWVSFWKVCSELWHKSSFEVLHMVGGAAWRPCLRSMNAQLPEFMKPLLLIHVNEKFCQWHFLALRIAIFAPAAMDLSTVKLGNGKNGASVAGSISCDFAVSIDLDWHWRRQILCRADCLESNEELDWTRPRQQVRWGKDTIPQHFTQSSESALSNQKSVHCQTWGKSGLCGLLMFTSYSCMFAHFLSM